ncbi:carboxypeptidase regulatory-like domain-containing protein [Capillimicrobium parvum]|uniref:carboxypeptidase regulatory-like domain-containing protein n=1 Tax=Capillimicrobium parvum TaxID=2884022 RepID=UPI00216B4A20|nr:carboxypeptidase regulatory-like domain-containing protein [Capillimicrobium parvum]
MPASAPAATGGKITGRVTDGNGGGLALGAAYAYRAGATQPAASAWIVLGGYTLSVPDDGDYKVYFVDQLDSSTVAEFYDDKPSLAQADPVTVRGGATVSRVDAALVTGGRISGRVRTTSGIAIGGATVAAYDAQTGGFRTSTTTASNGTYTLPAVAGGAYKLYVVGPSGGGYISEYYDDEASLAAADPVTVTAGRTTTVRDTLLAKGGTVSGRVTDAGGSGVDRVTVFAYRANTGEGAGGTYTAPDGTYQLDLEAGAYKLIFAPPDGSSLLREYYDDKPTRDAADPITVDAGRAVTGVNASLAGAGQIGGKVTDTAKTGIAGATVTAYSLDGQTAGSTTTGTGGAYTLAGLRAGSYKVGFSGPPNGPYVPEFHSDRATLGSANAVTVTAGRTTAISADLAKYAAFTGKVTAKSGGKAISGAVVSAFSSSGDLAGTATSNSTGMYTLDRLAPGTYKLRFAGPDGSTFFPEYYHDTTTLAAALALTLTSGRSLTISEALDAPPPPGQISGYVRGDSGARAAGVTVTAYTTAGATAGTATSAADGTYRIDGLAAGSYKVGFAPAASSRFLPEYYRDRTTLAFADAVKVTAGKATSVTGSLPERGAFTGKVTAKSGGKAIAGAIVTAFTPSGDVAGSATANSSGVYTVDGLAPGSYKLRFAGPAASTFVAEYYHDRATLATALTLSISSGRTSTISEALDAPPPPGRLSGYVRSDTGERLAGATVTAYSATGESAGTATTAADGTYAIDGLPAGPYKVSFAGPAGSRYVSEFFRERSSVVEADAVTVTAGRTTALNGSLHAPPAPAQVTGHVTDGSGRAIGGVTVTVYGVSETAVATATTGAGGAYTVDGLDSGTYRIGFAAPEGSRYISEFYSDRDTLPRARPVAVKLGKVVTIDAALAERAPAGAISGQVSDSARNRIAGVTVTAYDATGAAAGSGVTGADGTYTIEGLPAGDYRLGFAVPGTSDYVGTFWRDAPNLATAGAVSVRDGRTSTSVNAKLLTVAQAERLAASAQDEARAQAAPVVQTHDPSPVTGATPPPADAGTSRTP